MGRFSICLNARQQPGLSLLPLHESRHKLLYATSDKEPVFKSLILESDGFAVNERTPYDFTELWGRYPIQFRWEQGLAEAKMLILLPDRVGKVSSDR